MSSRVVEKFAASRRYERAAANHRTDNRRSRLSSCSVKVSHSARPGWRTRIGSTDDASENRQRPINGWFSKAKVSSSSSSASFLTSISSARRVALRECRACNVVQRAHLEDSNRDHPWTTSFASRRRRTDGSFERLNRTGSRLPASERPSRSSWVFLVEAVSQALLILLLPLQRVPLHRQWVLWFSDGILCVCGCVQTDDSNSLTRCAERCTGYTSRWRCWSRFWPELSRATGTTDNNCLSSTRRSTTQNRRRRWTTPAAARRTTMTWLWPSCTVATLSEVKGCCRDRRVRTCCARTSTSRATASSCSNPEWRSTSARWSASPCAAS